MAAEKNKIDKAAHGSSGVNELKTSGAGLLTSAKKEKSQLHRAAKKFFPAVLFFLPCFVSADDLTPLVDTNQSVQVIIETCIGKTFGNTKTINTVLSELPFVYFRNDFGVRLTVAADGKWTVTQPSFGVDNENANNVSTTGSYIARPVKIGEYYYPYRYFPSVCAIYRLVEIAYQSKLAPSAFTETGSLSAAHFCNVSLNKLISESLSSTNGQFRSTVVGLLSAFYSELQSLRADFIEVGSLNYDMLDSLNRMKENYASVHSFDLMSFTNALSYALDNGYISQTEHDQKLSQYNALSSDPSAQSQFARSVQSFLDTARRVADETVARINEPDTEELGKKLNQGIQDSLDGGFSASAHFHGATTNLLQRMTNQTEQIKQDLQAWRTDATNRLEKQWDGIKKIRENTDEIKADSHVTASGVSKIANDGVKIIGPIQVVQDTGQRFSVNLTDANLSTINNSIASGANEAMQMWLDEWDDFKLSQLPYMSLFSGFFEANTNLLSSIDRHIDSGFTNTLDSIYVALTNGFGAAVTNDIWDYYFDRFKKANEFLDDDGQMFSSIDNQRGLVFGNGFDEAEYKKLDWFSRVELLLYQIGYASTNRTESIEASDLEGEFDDVSDEIQIAASAFEGAARRVVGVFSLVGRFADAVKNAFADVAAPSTDGILLLEGGSWIFQEPLYLRVPVLIQNALRLVFQCVWYLSAFVIGWRLVSFAWGRVASLVRWLWSLIDV